jgi:alpha-L-fucosidase
LYFSSVGRNAKLLLNVPPMPNGLLHAVDVARLAGFRRQLTSMFEHDVAANARRTWRVSGHTARLDLTLHRASAITIARLEEDITRGQRVAVYALWGEVDGAWKPLSRGTTIGYAKLDRFPPANVTRVRVDIEDAAGTPEPLVLRLYGPS